LPGRSRAGIGKCQSQEYVKYDAAVADGILERRVRKKKQRKAKGRPPADSISEEAATRYASFGMVALYSILAGQ
jgi:hypothetical protein